MADQDPFKTTETSTTTVVTPQGVQGDPFADKLKTIVNPDGAQKYKDVETALDALNASQQFIESLKTEKSQTEKELADAREKLTQMGSIEDFVKRVAPTSQEPTAGKETPPAQSGLGEADVDKLIRNRLEAERAEAQQTANLAKVINDLTSVHGDKTAEHIALKAQELGTTPDDLRKLAKENPSLAIAALGGAPKKEHAPLTSSLQTVQTNSNENVRPSFEKGITQGGFTNKQLAERWKEVGKYTYKRLNVEEA